MKLKHAILRALDLVHPNLLPETVLHIDVNAALPEPTTFTELRRELEHLEKESLVVRIADKTEAAHSASSRPRSSKLDHAWMR